MGYATVNESGSQTAALSFEPDVSNTDSNRPRYIIKHDYNSELVDHFRIQHKTADND